ncbi:MBL fold metallo-hydrolase [Anaerocolumna sp. MB42-C2]|uniref:MBL fold metallo-hydrolase n=1 Tax=Anaerocolumna sp. MB42-C2 TaxID=3070997 RepID=UPI0027DEEF5B|nr:MBL fold metallo-hydrolase [Anaerocolumna sp. MB42-C2]WMJ89077.1 MBL fold metallo-hydrolase [Anaerocolumna sp. MB42-C2]
MINYNTIKIAQGFYSIEQDFVRSFLIEGDREALLIDTGVGDGNLKEYIEQITKLPVTVIFTHADGDHVGGAGQFERRFMHPGEFDYYKNKHENRVTVSMEPIWEGDIINLGSYCFEIILLPGHTPGSIALLEREKHFLIGGDSIQTGKIYMFGNGRNFEAFRASMKKLQGMLREFDTVYASHDALLVPADTVNQLYAGAGKVMENKVTGKPGELSFDSNIKCYETDGIAFYAY